jgi:hypothetical protein
MRRVHTRAKASRWLEHSAGRLRPGGIIVAGCYAGGFTELNRGSRFVSGASGAEQRAYENTAIGNSYLAYYLADAVAAFSTVAEMHAAATDAIKSKHPDRLPIAMGDDAGQWTL